MASVAKTSARPERLADFFEAAYDLERDDQSWLRGVMEGAVAVFGRGTAVHGAIYDASDVAAFRVQNVEFIGLSAEAIDCCWRTARAATASRSRSWVRCTTSWRRTALWTRST